MKKYISSVVLIGSAWGIVEATVGHFLHVFTLGIGWLFWFPIAFFFLNSVYRITQKSSCMLYTAVIAAGIKMIDIFYTPRYDYVINPAVSIILEAVSVLAVYHYLETRKQPVRMNAFLVIVPCILWKVFYISYLFFLPESWIHISCLSGLIPFAKFFFLETVMNTLMIGISLLAIQRITASKHKLSIKLEGMFHRSGTLLWLFSSLSLILAVIVQINL